MRRVVKLGGSLLDFEHVRPALQAWRAAQPPAADVLIVGGGDLAEAIRRLDRMHGVGETAAHWLCIRAMGVSARLAAAIWPEAALATSFAELTPAIAEVGKFVAFDAEDFLRREEPSLPGVTLPHAWSVTSDSIAARVAEVFDADELVLLKSALPERSPLSCEEAAAIGYVDRFFPRAAQSLRGVRAVNLRSPEFPAASLIPG